MRSGAASSPVRTFRSAAAATSSAAARERTPAATGGSFLISPPRRTRRSSTGTRSMAEMPSLPASSPDQNASRSRPTGVATPAATTATGSGRRGGAPDVEEIEPLLGRASHRGLEDARPPGERGGLLAERDPDRLGDHHRVAQVAPQQAEGRHHRDVGGAGQHERAQRKGGGRA